MGYNGYINPYYWVDDHPLLYGNNGSLDPSTYKSKGVNESTWSGTIISGEHFFCQQQQQQQQQRKQKKHPGYPKMSKK